MGSDARAKAVRLIVETLYLYPNYRVGYRSCWANLTDAVACFDPDAAAILRDPDWDLGALHDELLAREETAAAEPAPAAGEREEKDDCLCCGALGYYVDRDDRGEPAQRRCDVCDGTGEVAPPPRPAQDAVREAAERLREAREARRLGYSGTGQVETATEALLAAIDAAKGGE